MRIEKKIDSLATTVAIIDGKFTHLSNDVNDLTEIVVAMKGYMEGMDARMITIDAHMATKEDVLELQESLTTSKV